MGPCACACVCHSVVLARTRLQYARPAQFPYRGCLHCVDALLWVQHQQLLQQVDRLQGWQQSRLSRLSRHSVPTCRNARLCTVHNASIPSTLCAGAAAAPLRPSTPTPPMHTTSTHHHTCIQNRALPQSPRCASPPTHVWVQLLVGEVRAQLRAVGVLGVVHVQRVVAAGAQAAATTPSAHSLGGGRDNQGEASSSWLWPLCYAGSAYGAPTPAALTTPCPQWFNKERHPAAACSCTKRATWALPLPQLLNCSSHGLLN